MNLYSAGRHAPIKRLRRKKAFRSAVAAAGAAAVAVVAVAAAAVDAAAAAGAVAFADLWQRIWGHFIALQFISLLAKG